MVKLPTSVSVLWAVCVVGCIGCITGLCVVKGPERGDWCGFCLISCVVLFTEAWCVFCVVSCVVCFALCAFVAPFLLLCVLLCTSVVR